MVPPLTLSLISPLNVHPGTVGQCYPAWDPGLLTFSCRDRSERGGGRGSFQSREPIGPFLDEVYGGRNIPRAGDRGHTLAIWLHICFGCIFSRTWLWASCPETQTLPSVGRWRGRDPGNATRLLPGLAGSWLRGAVLLRGVGRERLYAAHGCTIWAAAVGITWEEEDKGNSGNRSGTRKSMTKALLPSVHPALHSRPTSLVWWALVPWALMRWALVLWTLALHGRLSSVLEEGFKVWLWWWWMWFEHSLQDDFL